MLTSKNTSI